MIAVTGPGDDHAGGKQIFLMKLWRLFHLIIVAIPTAKLLVGQGAADLFKIFPLHFYFPVLFGNMKNCLWVKIVWLDNNNLTAEMIKIVCLRDWCMHSSLVPTTITVKSKWVPAMIHFYLAELFSESLSPCHVLLVSVRFGCAFLAGGLLWGFGHWTGAVYLRITATLTLLGLNERGKII